MEKRTGGKSGTGRGRSATTGSARSSIDFESVEARLGHRFRNRGLLVRALTHASASADASNERLEFLGDRVLGLAVAEKLFALYPAEAEGILALKLNALVRKEACARAAEAAGFPEHLILATSEVRSGGRQKAVILAGACEAVIAALYLDGGMETARQFIERYWADMLASLGADMRDPKTVLQEWAQAGAFKSTPIYRLVKQDGPDHAPRFLVEVSVASEAPQEGEGGSKREAEQSAARAMLQRVGQA
ncbi:MAG: ribonuclease III [Alphaproteobacteria bacterium]|nr:ribonuclease III [Alphaproteobacteria bacterium]